MCRDNVIEVIDVMDLGNLHPLTLFPSPHPYRPPYPLLPIPLNPPPILAHHYAYGMRDTRYLPTYSELLDASCHITI